MTNIEKVKRILDAGHWVKATSEGFIITITSYYKNKFTYLHDGSIHISTYDFNDYKSHDIYKDIICLWENKRLPIDDQSEECIDFVYSLIKK